MCPCPTVCGAPVVTQHCTWLHLMLIPRCVTLRLSIKKIKSSLATVKFTLVSLCRAGVWSTLQRDWAEILAYFFWFPRKISIFPIIIQMVSMNACQTTCLKINIFGNHPNHRIMHLKHCIIRTPRSVPPTSYHSYWQHYYFGTFNVYCL